MMSRFIGGHIAIQFKRFDKPRQRAHQVSIAQRAGASVDLKAEQALATFLGHPGDPLCVRVGHILG
jgi:hypothetical protein